MSLLKSKTKTGGVLRTQPYRPDLLPKTTTQATKKDTDSGSAASAQTEQQPSDEEVLQGYVNTLYSAYKPTPITYEAQTAETLRAEIEAWLRPSYEQAITSRQAKTANYRAELDADAISRGMGASTYVTDVKNRQLLAEADDVAQLESNYGAALAGTLSDQLTAERERALEAETANKQNDYDAYMKAYSAALTMFSAYKASSGYKAGSGGGSGGSGSTSEVTTTSAENCDAFLKMLTPEQRADVYLPKTAEGQRYQDELIASVGRANYYRLMGKYPSSLG